VGLFNKIKDILFDEVDEEETNSNSKVKVEPPKEKEEKIAEKIEIKPKEEPRTTPRVDVEPEEKKVVSEPKHDDFDVMNERDLFKTDNNFPFLDFDEVEFSNSIGSRQEKTNNNVLEYEKKKKIEKRYEFGRVETKEVVEKKKFKPSPIISPVYGILNEDYRIEDIKDKTEENAQANLDFNSVRKKAFGDDTVKVETIKEEPKETYYEETITVKLKDSDEEQQKKSRTIDELLEDTADVIISPEKEENKIETVEDYNNIEEELEEVIAEPKKEEKKRVEAPAKKVIEEPAKTDDFDDDNTLESDLFDLIDSMYDNREDGEN